MKILAISDIHGAEENLDKLDSQFKEADIVLCAGDFSKFGDEETGLPVLLHLCKKHDSIFSVIGNCDNEQLLGDLEDHDICVQKSFVNYEGLVFGGSGGGSKFTMTTPYERTDEELSSDLDILRKEGDDSGEWNNLIVIMHNPPKDTKCDTISGGIHVGSPLLRKFIEDFQPLIVLTGHIHESSGIDKIGKSTVINPGALAEGKYAWLEIEKKDSLWSVKSAELKSL